MNAIWIVLPILMLLMFELGLTLEIRNFGPVLRHPAPVLTGLFGQIVLLPLLAVGLGLLFKLEPLFFVGLVLIACSPGGSSSNIFSMLAGGNVPLSILLTACSSIITLFTIPLVMQFAIHLAASGGGTQIVLPVGSLIVQNLLLVLLPVGVGVATHYARPALAEKLHKVLAKISMPALILLASIFFVQHHAVILAQIGRLGLCVAAMILLAMAGGWGLSRCMGFDAGVERTLIIEIGMQNAAQSIAIATSPFILACDVIAVPAIIYALMMNVILLGYVGILRRRRRRG